MVRSISSTSGVSGSTTMSSLVPVSVWKQCSVKRSANRASMPVQAGAGASCPAMACSECLRPTAPHQGGWHGQLTQRLDAEFSVIWSCVRQRYPGLSSPTFGPCPFPINSNNLTGKDTCRHILGINVICFQKCPGLRKITSAEVCMQGVGCGTRGEGDCAGRKA